ncbi:MAG TPA: ATP-dependent protease subunit HslV [Thermoanaerobaculia bacterium]|nr:ATP-dependent protease subunit HslV [Thermoanaerobaculia bacterium]HUM30811.1 ATP-dependent protease subunit HslV [Thermoanaerobaculia bacterium]HXK69146.1 ATP-dependent protease subunit HslV [Thermoanaerobaculia bacterium]
MKSARSTTILCLRHNGTTVMASDGQVTIGQTIVKHQATKIRRLWNGKVLAGFAGSAADALALLSRFDIKLQEYHGNFERAVVELAKDWRTDKVLRQLQAMMIVTDSQKSFVVSGSGDVIQPDDGILAIGSGGPYALAAAKALISHSSLDAESIAREAMTIASSICIYTNSHLSIEVISNGA